MNKDFFNNGFYSTQSYKNNVDILNNPKKNMDWLLEQIKQGNVNQVYSDDNSLFGLMSSLYKQCIKWDNEPIDKNHINNILKYSQNLPDYFAIWTIYIMTQHINVKRNIIRSYEWVNWIKKYASIVFVTENDIQYRSRQNVANSKKPLSVVEIMQEIDKLDNTDKQIIKLYISKF